MHIHYKPEFIIEKTDQFVNIHILGLCQVIVGWMKRAGLYGRDIATGDYQNEPCLRVTFANTVIPQNTDFPPFTKV